MGPLISIIIPVYNVSDYIISCMESVVNQTYRRFEVILIDDKGKDDSIEIATRFLSEASQPYKLIVHEKNMGVSAARNTGINEAKGDYVFFLDSDDRIAPDCLQNLTAPLLQKPFDIVIGGYKTFGENETDHIADSDICMTCNNDVIEKYGEGAWHLMPWNKLCRKDFIVKNNLYFLIGQALHEDFIWSFESACKADSAYLVSTSTYEYRLNPSSAMSTASIETDLAAYVPAFEKMIRFATDNNLTDIPSVYQMIEGKKNGILYSLLKKGELSLFSKYYPLFHNNQYISPIKAFQANLIGLKYLFRDIDNAMPPVIGKQYKHLFYLIAYTLRGKKVEGALWE